MGGISRAKKSRLDKDIMSETNFGYAEMLEINTPFNPADEDLNRLAKFIIAEPKKIPAGYTYLAQFIDHDIALDSKRKEDPWGTINPATITNLRNPVFDLETVYGFKTPSNPNEPARAELLKENSQSLLKLNETTADTIKRKFPNDLPRVLGSPIARIVDERNDDILPVAQTQVAFIKFHNAIVANLEEGDTPEVFEKARRIAIRHYQYIILKDLLPKIIKESVLNDVLLNGNKFYHPKPNNIFMPLEFSVAAFRAGHSLIRDSYQWNKLFNDDKGSISATLAELTTFTGFGRMRGKHNLPSDWLINWNWFYDINDSISLQASKFNFAKRIDTEIAPQLGFLGGNIHFDRKHSLPARDLYRTRALSLPTGQAVAHIIASKTPVKFLDTEQIANLLPENLKNVFATETPLWFYLLAEAEINERGQTLGDVGSRLIAETFVALLKLSPFSIFDVDLPSSNEFLGTDGKFGMPEMLKFIASKTTEFDELNPIKDE